MIGIKNIRLVLAGALIVPVALASIACSPIYADDPNGVKKEIFTPELDLEALNERIQSAVESGEISQAQVDTAIEILKNRFSKSHKAGFGPGWDIEEIKAKISAAVESGEITQAEADEKLADIETKRNERQEKMAAKVEEIKAKIAAAVESGEITQAEADQKLAGLEERKEKGWGPHAEKGQHLKKPFMDIEEIKAKISAAVESGELSAVEGESKLLYIDGKSKKATYY